MRGLPEIPDEDVAEYWQLVRDALVAGGMSKKEAAATAKAYREYMKPASWTIYNRDPEDSAEAAKDYAAWMQEEQGASKAQATPKRVKRPAKNADTLPTKEEIAALPRWARVAFAARCARRVLVLFRRYWPKAEERDVESGWLAVEIAELSATDAADYDAAASAADNGANLAKEFAVSNYPASAALNAARAADYAVDFPSESSNFAWNAGELAARAVPGNPATLVRRDFEQSQEQGRRRKWTDATPVPPAVFGPLWPEGPPADWPELPKPAKLKLTVRVPDGLDDAAVREKLKTLTTALARLNVAGGGHGLKLIPPVEFTQDQQQGRADVVREEAEEPKGRGHTRRGR